MRYRISMTIAFVSLLASSAGASVTRIIVLPVGTIFPDDTVSLKIRINTGTSKLFLAQPSEVTIVGNEVFVDIYPESGNLFAPDMLFETVDLGTFPSGDYQYQVVTHPGPGLEQTLTGTFCVQEPGCAMLSCQCPVFVPKYHIIDLGTLGGLSSVGKGINDLGQVVGSALTPQGDRHAFIWENAVMSDLGTIAGISSSSEASDINNQGQVVGNLGGAISFRWENGELILINDGPGFQFRANAINDLGQVVGIATFPDTGGEDHAFLWENGAMSDLGTLGGSSSVARDINNAAQVVGEASTGTATRAFLWESGSMSDLGTLGGMLSEARGINGSGQIIGFAWTAADENSAFLWEAGNMTDFGAVAGFDLSFGLAINDLGQVLGNGVIFSGEIPNVGGIFLHDSNEGSIFLEDLIPLENDWLPPFHVEGINNRGQIVGYAIWGPAGSDHAFLMTPTTLVPAVSPYGVVFAIILLLGAGILVIRNRERTICR